MKRFTPIWASALVAIMVFSGLLPLTMNVVAAIPIPHNMWGFPYDETGVSMDVDELITSWIDGVQYGDNRTWQDGPNVRYDIDTDGNWVTAPGDPNSPWEKEGGDLNEPIMFAWGDMTMIDLDPEDDSILNYGVFEETDPWITAVATPSDINLAVAQPPIFPKISMVIPEPTDTFPDYVLIYTEDPFFDMTGYYLEKNDGVLNGPSFALSGLSNATAYFYANLTTMDLDACGDELKLVWSNAGLAFGGNDIVVDRVEWNATTGGTHNVGLDHEPDNTIMTDAAAPACAVTDFAMRRGGIFPVFDTDTNDNFNDFVVAPPWPRPIIGAPVVNIHVPDGSEDWTGGSTHAISWTMYDNNFINTLLIATVNYTIDGGATWPAAVLDELNPIDPGRGDAFDPVVTNWTLPFADVTDARIRVCVENPAFLTSCDFSPNFEIDSMPPTVADTDPKDGWIEIPVGKVINILFSEAMDIDMTNTSFQFTPDPGGISTAWNMTTRRYVSLGHNNFLQNTSYCVDVLTPLAEDDSDPGNAIASTYRFCFTTYEPKAPTIDVSYPDGGQNWTGGSTKNIWFNYTHADGLDLTYIWLNYSCGGSEFNIAQGFGEPPIWGDPYQWAPLPLEDANDCYIHATIWDTDGDKLWDESMSPVFTIDSTAPLVILTDPMDDMGGISIATNVTVTFEEDSGMDRPSVEGAWSMMAGTTAVPGTFSWADRDRIVTFNPDNDLPYFTDCTITIDTGACDKSDPGNCLAADYIFNFTTEKTPPPFVEVLYPIAGTDWIAGEVLNITWNMTDDFTLTADLEVQVSLVYDTTTTPLIALTGEEVYDWTVACTGSLANADTTAHILVNVTDEEAQMSSDTSATFVIDCTIPSADIYYDHGGTPYPNEDISFDSRNETTDVAAHSWNFGDAGTALVKSPTHQYATATTFTVTLTVGDAAGNEYTVTRQITITTKPVSEPVGIEMWMLILIIIVVVAIIAIIAIAAKRRKKPEEEEIAPPEEEEEEFEEEEEEEVFEEEEAPVEEEEELVEEEEVVEEEAAPAPVAAAAPPAEEAPATEEEPAGATKECPSCGSEVPGDATECFLCGATL